MKRLIGTLFAAATIAACGSESSQTPVACLDGADVFLTALEGAPAEARLGGEVPIRDCLVDDQSAGQISTVGEAVITAATRLNREARRDPRGVETVRLGYLVGAVEDGAAETGGIHTDLVRRINAAARFTPAGEELPPAFERTFGAAYAAAREQG